MKKKEESHLLHPSQQLKKGSCSWLGQMKFDSTAHAAGQVFFCDHDTAIDSIAVFSSAVPYPGKVSLTLHVFDQHNHDWGPVMVNSERIVSAKDAGQWMEFDLPLTMLKKNQRYGFRLSSEDALVALGEKVLTGEQENIGEEWHQSGVGKEHFYRYFSLAYRLGMRA